jgi:RimJ/RimL family protein N-acetyltransferase
MRAYREILDTPRLVLRELVDEDLDFLALMLADEGVMRWYPAPLTRDEASDWLVRQRQRYLEDGCGLWLCVHRRTGEPVGQVGLVIQEHEGKRVAEVGYLLHQPHWGHGYATEAAGAVRDWAFAVKRAPRVHAFVRPENAPSRAVAERIGLREQGETERAGLRHLVYVAERPRTRRA